MPNGTSLPAGVHLVKDKEPTWILGGWIGNGIDEAAVWSKNIDKMQAVFERWGQKHPSLISRHLIVNMFAGGIAQYLTVVQGMPKEVESRIQKIINTLVWDGKSINLNVLSAPEGEGGISLLDMQAQNEAIQVMWLKKYTAWGH